MDRFLTVHAPNVAFRNNNVTFPCSTDAYQPGWSGRNGLFGAIQAGSNEG